MLRTILGVSLACICATGVAQQYPQRAVRIIVPFTPGGGTDFIGRLISAKLSATHGLWLTSELLTRTRSTASWNRPFERNRIRE